MRNPLRIARITKKLLKAWVVMPDMRFGQLIFNIMRITQPFDSVHALWNVEDDEFEQHLDKFFETHL
jgi:hypothetical protein